MNNSETKFEKFLTENNSLQDSYYLSQINDDPDSKYKKLFYAYHLVNNNKIDEAKTIIDNDRDNSSLKKTIEAKIYLSKGNYQKAEIEFIEALKLDKDKKNKWLRLELFKFYQANDPVKAWGFLEESLKMDKNFYSAIKYKYLNLDSLDNCQEIISNLSKLPNSFIDYEVYSWLGIAYYNCYETEQAILLLNKSTDLEENDEAFFTLGFIYHNELNDLEKAEKLYLNCLRINSENIDCINSLAWLYFDTKKYDLAENEFDKLLKINNDQESFEQAIKFNIRINKYDVASEILKKAKALHGSNFKNDGYEIILLIIFNKDWKTEYEKYKKKFSDYEINWFKSIVEELKI